MTVIAMWAHPRSISTAFLRMMIARGDLTVVHEPLVTLYDTGAVTVPGVGADGAAAGEVKATSVAEVIGALRALAARRPVFVKDTTEHHYRELFERPELMAGTRHTFIVREPAATIASHHAVKPDLSCSDVGYEHQYQLFELATRHADTPPVVVSAERLLADPAAVVAAYCAAVGLPFLPDALRWRRQDRPEWRRTREWHLGVIDSNGFGTPDGHDTEIVRTDPTLRAYYDHHLPFYQRLNAHAL